jgi:pyruvate kinase
MTSKEITSLRKEIVKIDDLMRNAEKQFSLLLKKVHPSNYKSAVNLLHYLVLRSLDIRSLQDRLHAAGLSSLTSSESHVRGQLLSVLHYLGVKQKMPDYVLNYEEGKESHNQNVISLMGEKQNDLVPFIMATFDKKYADDYATVKSMLQSGMNVARINCAHDDESTWFRMIQNIKRASKITGLTCKIYMDLAGPKIRTTLPDKQKVKIKEGKTIYLVDEEHLVVSDEKLIGCTIEGIVGQLKEGERVLFDDGLIEARVEKIEEDRAALQVLRISSKKPCIKHGKGINFPDSKLQFSALTEYDRACLPFVLKHADMVGYSFVRDVADLRELKEAMGKNRRSSLVIKIETPEAVLNLPSLLFCGLEEEHVGVMIARGDLAVEIGFERMSEIQEEILWICEAAHIPVIWATQVLENLNKSGVATRSEVTDAAHAGLADCVMINKGHHIIRVIETLKDILLRSGGHHAKKRYTFRPLTLAMGFLNQGVATRK